MPISAAAMKVTTTGHRFQSALERAPLVYMAKESQFLLGVEPSPLRWKTFKIAACSGSVRAAERRELEVVAPQSGRIFFPAAVLYSAHVKPAKSSRHWSSWIRSAFELRSRRRHGSPLVNGNFEAGRNPAHSRLVRALDPRGCVRTGSAASKAEVALIVSPGSDRVFRGRRVLLDTLASTAPVETYFETPNPAGLRVGMLVDVDIQQANRVR